MKKVLLQIPEYYLILVALVLGYTPPFDFHFIVLIVVVIIALQIFFKNRALGLAIACLFIFINVYMLGALLSEFKEFETFNGDAQQLLFVGSTIWVINMLASGLMIYKYTKNEQLKKFDVIELK